MEVKIGVTHAARELTIDSELDPAGIEEAVSAALTEGGVFTLADAKGRRVIVPVDRLAYVDVTAVSTGQVGFRS